MAETKRWGVRELVYLGIGLSAVLGMAVIANSASGGENKMERKNHSSPVPAGLQQATFAGGCFWCVEAAFDKLPGVVEATSGYTGGKSTNPTYDEVSSGRTGHLEAVQILFDPDKITYSELLDVFWRQIDPADSGGQFADRGSQYETVIFTHNDEQKRIAEQSAKTVVGLGLFGQSLATRIEPASPFFPAEAYHQNYAIKSKDHYERYKIGSGRAAFLDKVWKKVPPKATVPGRAKSDAAQQKPRDAELRSKLSPLTYHVTQERGTEPPFRNEYWNEHRAGIYVDAVTGEPLFSSKDKYDSGSGWPSFTRPLKESSLLTVDDFELGTMRTEVRSRTGDSHLGHLFDDGPAPTGQRYCINSAALRFVPVQQLEEQGYGEYRKLFVEPGIGVGASETER